MNAPPVRPVAPIGPVAPGVGSAQLKILVGFPLVFNT